MSVQLRAIVKIEGRKYRVLKTGLTANGVSDLVMLQAVARTAGDADMLLLPAAEVEEALTMRGNSAAKPPTGVLFAPVSASAEEPQWQVTQPATGTRYFPNPPLEEAEIFREWAASG